ncbi:hypothetical protein E2C01_067759 [Portunus trituberculatus]|uniref:Uncharacterized protein n=1 Tax=Portunus trituberculatus TaxID=210409 RepID=A0A5B7HLW8_PORTR|nr:hypothetical protein [Portunus trituberculatus]
MDTHCRISEPSVAPHRNTTLDKVHRCPAPPAAPSPGPPTGHNLTFRRSSHPTYLHQSPAARRGEWNEPMTSPIEPPPVNIVHCRTSIPRYTLSGFPSRFLPQAVATLTHRRLSPPTPATNPSHDTCLAALHHPSPSCYSSLIPHLFLSDLLSII